MSKLNILVVDDNPTDLRIAKSAIESSGINCHVEFAMDGEEAISYINKEMEYEDAPTPDLIFLDLNLPKENGLTILKEIKENNNFLATRVIIISGSKASSDKLEALNLDAENFLTKSCIPQRFIQDIKREVITSWEKISASIV